MATQRPFIYMYKLFTSGYKLKGDYLRSSKGNTPIYSLIGWTLEDLINTHRTDK